MSRAVSQDARVEAQAPWADDAAQVAKQLGVDPETGLRRGEARRRRQRYGPNELRRVARRSLSAILLDQFRNLIVVLLTAAAAVAFAFGELPEAVAIAVVILLNGTIGFLTEWRAVRAMEALRALSRVTATVVRDGRPVRLPAASLVPGDVVLFEAGDVVTADLRLADASRLAADEASLTGESVPVAKSVEAVAASTPLHARSPMLFKGTAVARGSGRGIVVATGMGTELGRIARLVSEAEPEATPLERRLEELGRRLIWVTLAIAAGVAALGVMRGQDLFLSIETAIALAVAAVPEGLPIVATVALARGLWRMARRNAIVERLSAVETLGSTSILLTDKTGTLTEGRMRATELRLASGVIAVEPERSDFLRDGEVVAPGEDDLLGEALRIATLCSNASLGSGDRGEVGDPTETALLWLARRGGVERETELAQTPELREEAFDPSLKMMATLHARSGHVLIAAKGAPEAVVSVCTHVRTTQGSAQLTAPERERWLRAGDEMARRGMRVLALAAGEAQSVDRSPYQDLCLVGLVGLLDPPRPGVRKAMDACRAAGIRVVMVTGDHAATARAISTAVGVGEARAPGRVIEGGEIERLLDGSLSDQTPLLEVSTFARATPEHKLRLIDFYQGRGEIVAMTGDGVNDAPALKKADIGVAMGLRGTQVAREASDLVLEDDELATIVAAVEQGRVIFGNIRKFALYLLSCNVSEVFVVGIAATVGAPLPLLPLQILFLNLVTDVFPALALGVGEGERSIMARPPRPRDEPLLGREHWRMIGVWGAMITFSVLGAFAVALTVLELSMRAAATVSFATLAFAQLWHVVNMRDLGQSLVANEITRNRWMWGALALCVLLVIGAIYVPILSDVIGTVDPGRDGWLVIGSASVLPIALAQLWRAVSLLQRADRTRAAPAGSDRVA